MCRDYSSLPSRERGLKFLRRTVNLGYAVSLPSRERGLKYCFVVYLGEHKLSLPSRERGLKYLQTQTVIGCSNVAPFAGAWIEIGIADSILSKISLSLPSRERGLKW